MRRGLWCAVVLVTAGCQCGGKAHPGATADAGGGGGSDGGATACLGGALTLSPATASLTLDGTANVPTQAFTVTAGGKSADVTALAWTATRDDDAFPGTVANGVFHPDPNAGGVVTIKAADSCGHSSTATVSLTLNASLGTPGGSFGGTVVQGGPKAPAIVYPNDGTRFPRNIYKQLFQWNTNGGVAFRLTFTGQFGTVTVYTDGSHPLCAGKTPAAGCWESDNVTWSWFASSNAGGTVDLVIDGLQPNDTNVYESAKITIGFSKRDVRGAIFYWSTTAAGVRRASVSDADPEAYEVAKPVATVLPDSSTVKCVACHTVSRDGKKMVAGTQTSAASGIFLYDVTLQSPPNDYVTTGITAQTHNFGTFSPDDLRLVVTLGGPLAEYDSANGNKVADLPLGAVKATHPDWSPTGNELVFATGAGDAPAGASLDVIAYSGNDAWGAIRTLAPASGQTNLFPSYSPEGDWVAYSRGKKGGHGDVTTQLYVIKADGSMNGAGIDLKNANELVNNQQTTGQFENNQPTWAPPGDYHWIAFNSLRPYGVVYPAGGTQQIWVAAVDLALADGGADPSYPAFRFSFQDVAENNHRAFWVEDVRQTADGGCYVETCPRPDGGPPPADAGPADAGACLPIGSACDQTSGPNCCSGSVCDVNPDGGAGTICIIIG